MTGRGAGAGARQRRLVRTRRLETEDRSPGETEETELSDRETGDEDRGSRPQPRPPPMASDPECVSGGAPAPVISAVSQWRQRAARAGPCQSQAADCVIRSPLQPAAASGPCLPSLA